MAKITVSAKEILADIKAGMNNTALMQKYGLSDKGLQSIFKKLVDAGMLEREESEKRASASEKSIDWAWKCPACGKLLTKQAECPDCGVIESGIKSPPPLKQAEEIKGAETRGESHPSGRKVPQEDPGRINEASSPPVLDKAENAPSKLFVAILIGVVIVVAYFVVFTHRPDPTLTEPLMRASFYGHVDIVRQLLDKGADVNAKDKDGYTALMEASGGGHVDVVNLLLAKGADINAKDKKRWTALMEASFGGHGDVVELLLAKGADVNAKLENGRTALMGAAFGGHVDVEKRLLDKVDDVNEKEKNGETALMIASHKGHQLVEILLMAHGAK